MSSNGNPSSAPTPAPAPAPSSSSPDVSLSSTTATLGSLSLEKGVQTSAAKKGKQPRKGANPLKARLKEQHNASASSALPSSSSSSGLTAPPSYTSDSPPFTCTQEGPLLTLLFGSAATQHAALARIETFYEAPPEKGGGRYLSWAMIKGEGRQFCRGYEAFNLPVEIVGRWVGEMREGELGEGAEQASGATGAWYEPFCNAVERYLLEHLANLGAVDLLTGPTPQADLKPTQSADPPTYLISSLSSISATSLPHERLHALYHLSPSYRQTVSTNWAHLSAKARRVIEHDLSLRGYDERVHRDEWQAYLLGENGPLRGSGLWGPKVKEETREMLEGMEQAAREEARRCLGDVSIWR